MEKQYTPEKKKEIPKTEKMNIPIAGAPEKKEKASETEKEEKKADEKKKKEKEEKKPKKSEAIVNGKDLPISTKHSMALCNFIKGRSIEEAVYFLEEVVKFKKALPMKGEIPHRKGKIMSGRYPINATKQFLKLLKQLEANATVNGLETEKGKIECKANKASRPYKRFGSERFKRTNVMLKLKEKEEKNKAKENKGEKKK